MGEWEEKLSLSVIWIFYGRRRRCRRCCAVYAVLFDLNIFISLMADVSRIIIVFGAMH